MALQLGFTWNQDPSSFKPKIEKFEPIRRENYELPVSLDFKVCVPPQITQELPQPMKFSNKPPSPRKLVQYTQISKKKPKTGLGPAILKKPKFSNFSGLSKDKLKKPLKNKPVKNHPKVAVKPE